MVNRRSATLLPRANWLLLILLLAGSPVLAQEPAWDLEQRVASSGDDSEEFLANSTDDPQRWPAGFSYAESSDLELGRDASHGPQMLGLRFSGLEIPPGAQIAEAVIEFTADSDQAEPLTLNIRAQNDVETGAFLQDEDGQGSFDLSSRSATPQAETWRPEPWAQGQVYQSPDIAGLLQGLVDRQGWQSGGSIVLLLSPASGAGGGVRSAYAFDGNPQQAPRLLVRVVASDAAADAPDDPSEVETPDPAAAPETTEEPESAGEAGPDEAEAGAEEAEAEADQSESASPVVPGPEPAAPEAAEAEPGAEPEQPQQPVTEPDAAGDSVSGPPGDEREPIRVEPVDPDPIIPPPKSDGPQLVWPGPEADERAEEKGEAEEREEEERQEEEPLGAPAGADDGQLAEAAPETRDEPQAEPSRQRYRLTANFQRGVEGSVLLSDYGRGVTVVTVLLENPDPSVTYSASIRSGTCGSTGQLVVDLEPVVGSRAFSTSLLSLDFDQLVAGEYHLNIYRTTDEFTRVSGCASFAGG